ncbi:MAG TPA: M23 family metallopeptidase [Candidatus Moranbacteria bacterium]|nr:M23 family metallopeptidase [Candidatus Moranbacteria bacterium]
MKSKLFISLFLIFFLSTILFLFPKESGDIQNTDTSVPPSKESQISTNNPDSKKSSFRFPIDRAGERVTKKPFGIFITPQNSPVQPERFYGFHTGADFEIFPEELNKDIEIKAICEGKILEKRIASGYGGVLIQSCFLENEPITVIYGHLNMESIDKKTGENLEAGEKIGFLGRNESAETDRERKHLHLGIHKGKEINIRGYANNENELKDWLDPMTILP